MSMFLQLFSEFRELERHAQLADISADEARHKSKVLETSVDALGMKLEHAQISAANAVSAQLKAEDSERVWRSRADWMETELTKVRMEMEAALKKISNWQAMMTGAPHVPFPEVYTAPKAPEQPAGPQPALRPTTMRDLQRTANLKARMDAYERAKAGTA